ncbi:uncharacterized protein METZ01_LOCUS379840, partial [marine metagenome]
IVYCHRCQIHIFTWASVCSGVAIISSRSYNFRQKMKHLTGLQPAQQACYIRYVCI